MVKGFEPRDDDVVSPEQLFSTLARRNYRIAVIGNSESGKSVLVKEIGRCLLSSGVMKHIACFSSNVASAARSYDEIISRHDDGALLNFDWASEKNKLNGAIATRQGDRNEPMLVIFDDLGGQKDVSTNASIKQLYTCGREREDGTGINMHPIFINQAANKELSTDARRNSNLIFFGSNVSDAEFKLIFKDLPKQFTTKYGKKDFDTFLAGLECFMFGAIDKVSNTLFKIKAPYKHVRIEPDHRVEELPQVAPPDPQAAAGAGREPVHAPRFDGAPSIRVMQGPFTSAEIAKFSIGGLVAWGFDPFAHLVSVAPVSASSRPAIPNQKVDDEFCNAFARLCNTNE